MACLLFYKIPRKVICILFALRAGCCEIRLWVKKTERFRNEIVGKSLNLAKFLFLFNKSTFPGIMEIGQP